MSKEYSRWNRGPRQRKFRSDDDWFKHFTKLDYKHQQSKRGDLRPPHLCEGAKFLFGEDGGYDGWTEYGFIPGSEDWTEEDAREWAKNNLWYIRSAYDCTGKAFSYGIHTHKNPNGLISYIHYVGIDV